MKRPGDRLFAILADAARLSDDEVLELHRVLSITTSRIRRRDPEYLRRWEAGVVAAQDALELYDSAHGAPVARRRRLELVQ